MFATMKCRTLKASGLGPGEGTHFMELRWYAAKVHRGRESALREQLVPLGIVLYHPEIIVNKQGRRRLEPLFPSHLFCKADPEDATWLQVRRATGLKYFLGPEHRPTPVEDRIVDTLRERVADWNSGGWREVFKPGDPVLVNAGPFKGLEAIFVRYLPAKERCKILLATLAHQHEVELDTAVTSSPSGPKPLSPGKP